MPHSNKITRRCLVKSSVFGALGVGIPNLLFAGQPFRKDDIPAANQLRYPAIAEPIVEEVVGVSHFSLDRLKELVNPRPELARATWDWGFGDWETALGAASHTGRRDIAKYLLSKGARPDIFTFAMLGAFDAVKAMIDSNPGIQSIAGPHGISLLQHVRNGIDANGSSGDAQKLVAYLEGLGDADSRSYLPVADADKQAFLGNYKYGDGERQGFSVRMNMRKLLSFGKLGQSGGALYRIGDNKFTYNGAPSVVIGFQSDGSRIVSLTVTEPGLVIKAVKV